MELNITRDEAMALLKKYNKEDFHILHALTVEGVMRYFAETLGYEDDADFWAVCGLLHDVDFECFPDLHCKKAPGLLAEINASTILFMQYALMATEFAAMLSRNMRWRKCFL